VNEIMEMARAANDVYLTAYREGQKAGLKTASRLAGAIEDYLDGESQGNVTGLRQALAAFESAKGVEQ
jgi:hypothetical protein